MQKHILYITQYYFTGEDIGSQRSYRNVKYLVEQGYKVTLITTYVNMLTTKVPDKYKKHDGKRISKETMSENFDIYFVASTKNFKKGFLSRAKSFLSFSINSFMAGLKVKNIDLVIGSGPPVFSCSFGYLIAQLNKANYLYEVRDLWPEALSIAKTNTNPLIYNFIWQLDKYLCQKAKKIIVLNRGIKQRVLLRKVDESKVESIPNGADLGLFKDIKFDIYPKGLIRENDDDFIVTYAGNHSILYNIEDIIEVAKKLDKDYPKIKFALVGDGYLKQSLIEKAEKENLSNLAFYDPQPRDSIPEILASSNACLLTSKEEEYMKWSFGNKILDYMTSGRAMIVSFCESESTDVTREMNCGLISEPGDIKKTVENIIWLYNNPQECSEMGKRARQFIEENYDGEKLLDKYGKIVEEVINK